ncbi:hypothetical protein M501DRAFT_924199 [Patellaria atrata CBS 101060]|uniref:Uncharacterized protein n=1 Tax=Patellaria atrata CBS 101060 TaxID=1346257 RepID=A0A9P4VRS7_9PEZI|nr:hypothetical protein M501DRAFT_924199 [Patellaria atrata CBS 101060]
MPSAISHTVDTSQDPQVQPRDWDEDRCRTALAHLERLENQIQDLRFAIASLIQPLISSPATPEQLFHDFSQAGIQRTKDISDFKATWADQQTQDIFRAAKESEQRSKNLSGGLNIPKYGWLQSEDELENKGDIEAEQSSCRRDEDISSLIDAFKVGYPKFTVTTTDGSKQNSVIEVRFRVPTMLMNFIITRKELQGNKGTYGVECVGSSETHRAINRFLSTRPHFNNLEDVLNMISSYADLWKAKCSRCGKLLDNKAMTPVGRKRQLVDTSNGKTELQWHAFHEVCV